VHFHELVKQFREAGAITQRELARVSGFSYDTIRSFEYGRRRPRGYPQLFRLVDALGLDTDEGTRLVSAYMFGNSDTAIQSTISSAYRNRDAGTYRSDRT
jgi:transcriptional regulator with XRE-family HTH domain